MGNTFFFDWEVNLITYIQSLVNEFGVTFFSLISELGDRIFAVLILCLLYLGYDKKFGKYVAVNVLSGVAFNALLKNVFDRRRPYFDHEDIESMKQVESDADVSDLLGQGYSFPSGHATNTSAIFGSLYIYTKNKKLLIISIIICLLVGISRFALGVHYPTDVIFGWLLGLITIYIISFLRKRLSERNLYLLLFCFSLIGCLYCDSNDYYSGIGLMLGCFSAFLFEEKYVKFENTNNITKIILRLIFGVIIFLGISTLIKLPFPSEVLDAKNALAFSIRAFRYALASFITLGIYPLSFKKFNL